MAADKYDSKECEDKREKIYDRIGDNSKRLGEIAGGVKMLIVMLPTIGFLLALIIAIVGWVAKDQLDQLRRATNNQTDTEQVGSASLPSRQSLARKDEDLTDNPN